MSWELFWLYRPASAAADGNGFAVFSAPHILWLVFLTAAAVLFSAVYRRGDGRRRDNMRKGMALFLIFYEILKQCLCPFVGVPAGSYLPLELCSFAEYTILIDALWPKKPFFGQLLAFVFLPSALIALSVPSATRYPPVSFFAIHQFVMHGGIAAYILARLSTGEIRAKYGGLWLSLLSLIILILPVCALDAACGRNYMFLTWHENNPALLLVWKLSGGSGGFPYVFGLAALAAIVMHVMYAVYAVTGVAGERLRDRTDT
ncbi:MAG: YwaF family protein [Oscillibacter sp.]|nr:YwaF family protein [Oscillibacter sp.]